MFNFLKRTIGNILKQGAETRITDEKFITNEINEFFSSPKRSLMLTGKRYYEGNHDILTRKRTVIGQNGELEVIAYEGIQEKLIQKVEVYDDVNN